jgi:hypothetical protein
VFPVLPFRSPRRLRDERRQVGTVDRRRGIVREEGCFARKINIIDSQRTTTSRVPIPWKGTRRVSMRRFNL